MHVGLVHYAAPPTVGGVEQTLFHHARILLALNHRVTVVAGQGAPFLPGLTYHEEARVGSRHPDILAAGRELAQGRIPPSFPALVASLRDALAHHLAPCDVVIGHNLFTLHKNLPLTAAVYELTQSGQGAPWIAWHHDFAWLRPDYQPHLHAGEPWDLLRRPWSGVRHVTVSAAQREDLAILYGIAPAQIAVIPPGVEPLDFLQVGATVQRLAERWALSDADALFLLPARLTRRKQIGLAMHWLAAIRATAGWDARLVVTGPPGPHNPANAAYLAELLALRQTLGLKRAVHFVYEAGDDPKTPLLLSDAEVAAWFRLADALLFPSQQEGFGIPLLEAGLARLPIFATDLPPFRESAGSAATLFAPDTPPEEVARAIIATLGADRAFGLRRRVQQRFTWQRIVREQMLPLLHALVPPHFPR